MNDAPDKTQSPARVIHELQHAAHQYRIITSDEEIINRTGEQIVRACQLQTNVAAWRQNFDLAVQQVAKWCEDHREQISFALVDFRSDKMVFYVIPASDEFDFDLAEAEADLDVMLNTRGGIGYAETRQIPGWEIDRFVSPNALRVWPTDTK